MPRVRYTGTAVYNLRDGPTWSEGDVHEVDRATAERLCEQAYFEHAKADDGEDSVGESEAPGDGDDGGVDSDAADEFDTAAWLEADYEVRAERVTAGAVDAHLDAVEAAERSQTVIDAVEQRRADLEG